MTLTLVPDIEKLASDFLRANQTEIGIEETRVVGKTPGQTSTRWIRVTQINAPAINIADHLIEFMVQCDCYAGATGGQPEANLVGRSVRAILQMLPGDHSGDVVTGVEIIGDTRLPDTDFEPARERRIVTAVIWAHA